MLRGLSYLCGVACVGLAGWGLYLALGPQAGGPPLRIDRPDREWAALPVGDHDVEFEVVNRSWHPCHILGVGGG